MTGGHGSPSDTGSKEGRQEDHNTFCKRERFTVHIQQVCAPSLTLHQDYDCFYAAVFEREDPSLKSLPFAVQQKQIIVTCNYEARRRGLYKLQLVKEARKQCPEVVIALGEDLTRFRDASKELYLFLQRHIWGTRAERLGFDEVSGLV